MTWIEDLGSTSSNSERLIIRPARGTESSHALALKFQTHASTSIVYAPASVLEYCTSRKDEPVSGSDPSDISGYSADLPYPSLATATRNAAAGGKRSPPFPPTREPPMSATRLSSRGTIRNVLTSPAAATRWRPDPIATDFSGV